MPCTEKELKIGLKEALVPLYFLYGAENYLSAHYAREIAKKTVGNHADDGFTLQRFDGQTHTFDQIEEAVEALPLFTPRKCVIIRDFDMTANAAVQERVLALLQDPPSSCVTVFWMDAVMPDCKKNAKWKAFAQAVEKAGMCVEFPRRMPAELVSLLCTGAARRGCQMQPETARLLIACSGNDMHTLLNELDKLSALAHGGEITAAHVQAAATKQLEASVFKLSDALLQNQYERAYQILDTLWAQREEPVAILGVLSSAYVDLYRAKVAAGAGVAAETLAGEWGYRGKEFRLRNAARDCGRFSLPVLRNCLEVLAAADEHLKSSRVDKRVVLEQTAAQLIVLAKTGKGQAPSCIT